MQRRIQRHFRPLTVLIHIFFFYIIICCLFSLLLYSFNGRIVTIQKITAGFATRSIESYLPICVDDLLVKQNYHFEKWARRIFNTDRLLISKKQKGFSCRLLHYTLKRAVTCIDVLHQEIEQEQETKTRRFSKLNFVFMGDSRIRQQFYNFLKLIPDYDRRTEPLQIPKLWTPFHGDVDVYSSVLSLQVSFKWRPIINETVLEIIRQWSISDQSKKPNFLFLGMEVYHMMQQYGADFQIYSKRLNELAPILGQLANASRVIWLNQYPTVEFYGSNDAYNTNIHSEKVHHYNTAARQILKNFNGIHIWDSSNPLAEEYVRGCSIFFERENPIPQFIKTGPDQFINNKPYINCLDYIHTGYAALSQATELLYNDICNKIMYQN